MAPVYLWVRLVRIAPGGRSPAAASVRLAPLPRGGMHQWTQDRRGRRLVAVRLAPADALAVEPGLHIGDLAVEVLDDLGELVLSLAVSELSDSALEQGGDLVAAALIDR
jgi:hypothetical protein